MCEHWRYCSLVLSPRYIVYSVAPCYFDKVLFSTVPTVATGDLSTFVQPQEPNRVSILAPDWLPHIIAYHLPNTKRTQNTSVLQYPEQAWELWTIRKCAIRSSNTTHGPRQFIKGFLWRGLLLNCAQVCQMNNTFELKTGDVTMPSVQSVNLTANW